MKRFHVHLNVADLDASIVFYSRLFAASPSVVHADYAKWMLDDPAVNFAISHRGRAPGIDHLGLQVDDAGDLADIGARLAAADAIALSEDATACCYARSDKHWTNDPQGVRWETFRTHGTSTTYGNDPGPDTHVGATAAVATAAPCCGPKPSPCCG
jgi:catechol 2,3-dioxygenase-like lactoylglutathione lyase family enzyme